jgi:hypothetical protein
VLCSAFALYWIWAGSVAGQQLSVQDGKNWQPTCSMYEFVLFSLNATGIASIVFFVVGVYQLVRKRLFGIVWLVATIGSVASLLGILVVGSSLGSQCFD